MSDPFLGTPDTNSPRPTRRRFQPGPVQEAFREMSEAVRARLPVAERGLRRAGRASTEALHRAHRRSQDLWRRGKRNPRNLSLIAGAVALTFAGAYTLSASAADRSLCPAASSGKAPKFVLLMDTVPNFSTGSELQIHYDVCGLPSGSPYKGRVRITQQRARKKGSAKTTPKPEVVAFKDRADGPATRRHRQFTLASTKPGAYRLELVIADDRGRERTRAQKILITSK